MVAPEASRSSGNGRAVGAVALGLLSAATMPVAIVATRAMLRGKPVVTSGWANRMAAFFVKLMPRSWATAMSGLLMRPKTAAS